MKKTIKTILLFIIIAIFINTTAFAEEISDENTNTEQTQESTEDTPADIGLQIDNLNIYENMEKSYHEGYVPTVRDSNVYLVLPLVGKTSNNTVSISLDLGEVENSPFVFGNYNQTIVNENLYLFQVVIPLNKNAINGTYPIEIFAEYLSINGEKAVQNYTVHVSITSGISKVNPDEIPESTTPEKVAAENPDLYISKCNINPASIGGNEEFDVEVTINNIGNLKARNIKVTYGDTENLDISPVSAVNVLNTENIALGEASTLSFKLKTSENITDGMHSFPIKVDYVDFYGGIYSFSQEFMINVTRTAQIDYDALAIPKKIESGATIEIPVNVFNVGKASLKNVKLSLSAEGLTPVSSVFLGDIDVSMTGSGTLSVFAGTLSNGNYGSTQGTYTINYDDENGQAQTITNNFETEITAPTQEDSATTDEEAIPIKQPDMQWWVSLLIGLSIIAIIVSIIVTGRILRANKMKH